MHHFASIGPVFSVCILHTTILSNEAFAAISRPVTPQAFHRVNNSQTLILGAQHGTWQLLRPKTRNLLLAPPGETAAPSTKDNSFPLQR